MSIKVLITDPISDKGLELLKNNNIEIIYEPDLCPEELLKASKRPLIHLCLIQKNLLTTFTKLCGKCGKSF